MPPTTVLPSSVSASNPVKTPAQDPSNSARMSSLPLLTSRTYKLDCFPNDLEGGREWEELRLFLALTKVVTMEFLLRTHSLVFRRMTMMIGALSAATASSSSAIALGLVVTQVPSREEIQFHVGFVFDSPRTCFSLLRPHLMMVMKKEDCYSHGHYQKRKEDPIPLQK